MYIGGRFAIDFKEGGQLVPLEKYQQLTLNIKDVQPIEPEKSYDTYVVMAPFTLMPGQDFKMRVYSDLGVFTQSSKTDKEMEFAAGKMNTATIAVKGSTFEEGRVYIPDPQFEQYLMQHFNTDGDGMISEEEAKAITELNVNSQRIKSLEGIEYMPNLKKLYCAGNELQSINLRKNKNLTVLDCSRNKLTELNLQELIELTTLNCSSNLLEELNLEENKKLQTIDCQENKLTELIVRHCDENLRSLNCSKNALKGELDISRNYKLGSLDTRENKELTAILVWDGFEDHSGGYRFYKDPHTSYLRVKDESPACQIPDENFRKYLLEQFDRNKDGVLSEFEAKGVTAIEVSTENILSVEGLAYFPNLEELNVSGQASNYMGQLTELNISQNPKLKRLMCEFNSLKKLDLSMNPLLESLNCDWNELTKLDISQNPLLETVSCRENKFVELNLGQHPGIRDLDCSDNNTLFGLKVKEAPNLERLNFSYTGISELDISGTLSLRFVQSEQNNWLTKINAKDAKALQQLICKNGELETLILENCPNLETVECTLQKLQNLEVKQCPQLSSLACSDNQLKSIDISEAANLKELKVYRNQLSTLDISNNQKLEYLHTSYNPDLNVIYVWKGFKKGDLSCIVDSQTKFVEK